jgi:hypothetical protein
VLLLTLTASFALGASAAGAAVVDFVPVYAGIDHARVIENARVVVVDRAGRRLAPPARTNDRGAATVHAAKKLPSAFVVRVSGGRDLGHRSRHVLEAAVRGWNDQRVVYVTPFTTIVAVYLRRHPRLSFDRAMTKVKDHLQIDRRLDAEYHTFWSEWAFSGRRFHKEGKRYGGVHGHARHIADEIDARRTHHAFRGNRRGSAVIRPRATDTSLVTEFDTAKTNVENAALAAKAAATATSAASGVGVIYQLGKLLDSALGGGDTRTLNAISEQLGQIEAGVSNLETQVDALDAAVSGDTYDLAMGNYAQRRKFIDTNWRRYQHLLDSHDAAERAALVLALKGWDDEITSDTSMGSADGADGLPTLAQNAVSKRYAALTSETQAAVNAAGLYWTSYWLKDEILHEEKWNSNDTNSGVDTPNDITDNVNDSTTAQLNYSDHGYATAIPEGLVYYAPLGRLYSTGTDWKTKPTTAKPLAGNPDWALLTDADARGLPADVALMAALVKSAPESPYVGGQASHVFALNSCASNSFWDTNGQGTPARTGAPTVELCHAIDASTQTVYDKVCAEVTTRGLFFTWGESGHAWPGRNIGRIFTNCGDFDFWNSQDAVDPTFVWGTGLFVGDRNLLRALNIDHWSGYQSAYWALWSRSVNIAEKYVVGPAAHD